MQDAEHGAFGTLHFFVREKTCSCGCGGGGPQGVGNVDDGVAAERATHIVEPYFFFATSETGRAYAEGCVEGDGRSFFSKGDFPRRGEVLARNVCEVERPVGIFLEEVSVFVCHPCRDDYGLRVRFVDVLQFAEAFRRVAAVVVGNDENVALGMCKSVVAVGRESAGGGADDSHVLSLLKWSGDGAVLRFGGRTLPRHEVADSFRGGQQHVADVRYACVEGADEEFYCHGSREGWVHKSVVGRALHVADAFCKMAHHGEKMAEAAACAVDGKFKANPPSAVPV